MALTLILSVGSNPDLMGARNQILQSAGYFVVPAYSLKEAVDRFQRGDFDIVLLCASLPTKDRVRLTCWIRASGSRIPVVSVSGEFCQEDLSTNETVASVPESLLMGIREALIKSTLHAASTANLRSKQEAPAIPRKNPQRSTSDSEGQAHAQIKHFDNLAHAG
jgi:CheY-like chemotaxis protein